MTRSRQIAVNAASQWGVTIIGCAMGILLVPFLIEKLGKDGYGLIAVIITTASVCSLADLGVSQAVGRHLAAALARDDPKAFNEYSSTAVMVNVQVGLATAGTLLVFAEPLARLCALPESMFDMGVFLLRSYGACSTLVTFLTPVARAVLASHNRFDLASQLDALRRLIQSASLFAVLGLTNSGLVGWAVVSLVLEALSLIVFWWLAFRVHHGLRVGISGFRSARLKELCGLGSHLAILNVSSQLSNNADPFILTSQLGPGSLTFYRPSGQLLGLFSPVISTLANQLHPLATTAHVQRNKEELINILFRGTKYTMLMGVVFCGIVISLAYPLCKVWLGDVLGEQYTICAAVLTVQTGTQLFFLAAGTQWPVLLGMKCTRFAVFGRLGLAVVNVLASWALVRYTALGVLGVVIPTFVIEAIWRPLLIRHVCRVVGVSVWEYVRQAYLSALAVGGVVLTLGLAVLLLAPPNNLWSLIATAGMLGLTGAALIWFVGCNPSDRTAMLAVVRSLVGQRCGSGT